MDILQIFRVACCISGGRPRQRKGAFVQHFDYIGYELIQDGRIAVITLDRPKQRNAQNRGMLVELGTAFELAEEDDTVRVVILRGRPQLLCRPRSRLRRRRPGTLTRARSAPDLPVQWRDTGRRQCPAPAGMALLLPEHQAVAQPAQDHDRRGAWTGVVGRADADLVLRPDRRRRGHGFRRRRRHPARDVRRGVLRPSLGIRPSQSQRAAAHRRLAERRRRPRPGHGQQRCSRPPNSRRGQSSSPPA